MTSCLLLRPYKSEMATNTNNAGAEHLVAFLRAHPRVTALTGAGISASSGIPTYRDESGRWLRSEPIQHQAFVSNESARQRYWGRSVVGWPAVQAARPNEAHRALARLEALGTVNTVITQNVDRLHQRAGSRDVIDLHGRLDRVVCLDCGDGQDRETLQHRLTAANPKLQGQHARPRPDGDADIADDLVSSVTVPECPACSGVLMPDVVFFGGSVPRQRVDRGMEAIASSDALLVLGRSLTVYSGSRFCRRADSLGTPIAIINPGVTRADDLAALKLTEDCGPLLSRALESVLADSSATTITI